MENLARLRNLIAKRHEKQSITAAAAYEKKPDLTRRYFSAGPRVFEFGCGTEPTAKPHAAVGCGRFALEPQWQTAPDKAHFVVARAH